MTAPEIVAVASSVLSLGSSFMAHWRMRRQPAGADELRQRFIDDALVKEGKQDFRQAYRAAYKRAGL